MTDQGLRDHKAHFQDHWNGPGIHVPHPVHSHIQYLRKAPDRLQFLVTRREELLLVGSRFEGAFVIAVLVSKASYSLGSRPWERRAPESNASETQVESRTS